MNVALLPARSLGLVKGEFCSVQLSLAARALLDEPCLLLWSICPIYQRCSNRNPLLVNGKRWFCIAGRQAQSGMAARLLPARRDVYAYVRRSAAKVQGGGRQRCALYAVCGKQPRGAPLIRNRITGINRMNNQTTTGNAGPITV